MTTLEPNSDNAVVVRNMCEHECEGSIAEANDCLRSVWGKLEWYDRKQRFCPHLISAEDSEQVKSLMDRLGVEQTPVMEFDNRLSSGQALNISNDLKSRLRVVCDRFRQMTKLLTSLYDSINTIVKKDTPMPSL